MPDTKDTTLAKGSAKLEELQDFARSPALSWIQECFNLGLPFRVLEVYRDQERQNKLFLQGRTEDIVLQEYRKNYYDKATMMKAKALLKASKTVAEDSRKPRVTWTLNSSHNTRLAVDIQPLFLPDEEDTPNIRKLESASQKLSKRSLHAYDLIEEVAKHYGISRPLETRSMGDNAHFDVRHAKMPNPPITSAHAQLRGLQRQLDQATTPSQKATYQKRIDRLKARL